MCTQTLPDVMLQSLESQNDQNGSQPWPAHSKDDSVLTVADAAVLERSPESSSTKKMACNGGLKAAVQPGIQHQPGAVQPLPSLLRSLKQQRSAGQKAVPAGKIAPEQQKQRQQQPPQPQSQPPQPQPQPQPQSQLQSQSQPQPQLQQQRDGGRVQMVAKAVEEAMRAGLLPAALGESCEGETLTTRILNNFHAAQKSEAADGENSFAKCAAEVPTPTGSTCTHDSPMHRSSSADLDSASSQGGEQGSRVCESLIQDESVKEMLQPVLKSKGGARNKTSHQTPGRALPSWLSNDSPAADAREECVAEQVQKHMQSPNRSGLFRDKLRARGRQSLDAMEATQGPQPLSLDILRARGHNVLAGVSKQQESVDEQVYTLPAPPGLQPAGDRVPMPVNLMPPPGFDAAHLASQISDSSQLMFMPPPGLPLPARAGDATCAYLLSAKQGAMPRSCAAGQGQDNEPAHFLQRQFPSGLRQEETTSQEDVVFIDNVYDRLDQCFPMAGSMGKPCTAEFGDEPLKIDFASLQSLQFRG